MNVLSRSHFTAIPAWAETARSRSGGLSLCAPGVVGLALPAPFGVAAGILLKDSGDNGL